MTDSVASTREYEGLQIPVAGTYKLDAAHKRVGFVVRHLMVSKVRGNFAEADATIVIAEDPLQSSVTATITTASVQTGNVDRDNHLRTGDFFEAETYPTITFVSTSIKPDGDDYELTGDLTIKGVTKPVTWELEFNGVVTDPWGNTRAGFSAETEVNRKDWGLDYNAVLEAGGLMIGEKVKLTLEIEALKSA